MKSRSVFQNPQSAIVLGRREFISTFLLAPAFRALPDAKRPPCWLRVVIPFLFSDSARNLESEIVLVPTSFAGVRGFEEGKAGNLYRIHIYDADGNPVASEVLKEMADREPKSLAALRSESLSLRKLLPSLRSFWGSAVVEIRPTQDTLTHYGDLFSAAFVRWELQGMFDCIHANPDPPQLGSGGFASTMPFLSTEDWTTFCTLFNPAEREAKGVVRILDAHGKETRRVPYRLKPRATRILAVSNAKLHDRPELALEALRSTADSSVRGAGTLSIENEPHSPKCFSYMLVRGHSSPRQFAVEHPIFQGEAPAMPALETPLDSAGRLRARTMVFTPLWFSGYKCRGLTLDSSACLSSGKGLGAWLWMQPFATGPDGSIYWTSTRDSEFLKRSGAVAEQGYLRMAPFQSIFVAARDLGLPAGWAGGFALATAPETNHSLMKIQVTVREWDQIALSHFRPGSRLARPLAKIPERGGVVSDYVIAGVQIRQDSGNSKWDSLLAIYNIEFEEEHTGAPLVQLFGPSGLIRQRKLGPLPPLGSRHVWASEIFPDVQTPAGEIWSLRLIDESAVVVASAIHFDFAQKQLGIDHGSDRFSTYLDYPCL